MGIIGENTVQNYAGKPFCDSVYHGGPQQIPGLVQCAYFDVGGIGTAWFNRHNVNYGSGRLNPADGTYLNEFRMQEGMSTSYIKANDIDNTSYNFYDPPMGQLYIGWTEPGDWVKYTVDVMESCYYTVSLLYTSRYGGVIGLSFDDREVSGPIALPSTFHEDDPLPWRQWHHWNKLVLHSIRLEAGIRILTLNTLESGNMNYAFLEFLRESGKGSLQNQ
jgi:hypothetical protein